MIFLLRIILFHSKKKTRETDNNGTKVVEIMVPLKYLSNFRRNLEIPLINCEINLILTWSANCFLIAGSVANQVPTFRITDMKLYLPIVTLSTQDNVKLFEQLKIGFKRTINWNKYQSKITTKAQNQYLDFLIGLRFHGVNRIFCTLWTSNKVQAIFSSNRRNKRLECYGQ